MLLATSILCMFLAVACLHFEEKPRHWHLSRYLLALSGFFVGLAFVAAAAWAWLI